MSPQIPEIMQHSEAGVYKHAGFYFNGKEYTNDSTNNTNMPNMITNW